MILIDFNYGKFFILKSLYYFESFLECLEIYVRFGIL